MLIVANEKISQELMPITSNTLLEAADHCGCYLLKSSRCVRMFWKGLNLLNLPQ